MRRRLHPHLILAGVLLGLLAVTGSASAATELRIASEVRKVTLSAAGVRQWKYFVSPLAHLRFAKPGTQYVTLHVDLVYRASLLRAGSIILGIVANGY